MLLIFSLKKGIFKIIYILLIIFFLAFRVFLPQQIGDEDRNKEFKYKSTP
jgi:hypothetical protein